MTKDNQGQSYLKLSDAKVGQWVTLDGGFTCISSGTERLFEDEGGLYFRCKDGKHYISGQADDGVHCVGIYPS